MIKLKLINEDIIYDTVFVTSRLFRRALIANFNQKKVDATCLLCNAEDEDITFPPKMLSIGCNQKFYISSYGY